ncbi:MacB family efflux pump subunit [Chiayiivirga flava]|uniref:Macrolide transport system ATP-binding/permease protein n=1 Tax=Chiayiivirga flava TaxID=659595 RepID=A0A7W8G263_9GAMM|nr:MacB family efflux pump subunit [Chiayiivirga flava]MBB5209618.1 macrolide transport system ATP-binding/permease protein [Chiayiivirga flava]
MTPSAAPLLRLTDVGRRYASGEAQVIALDGVTLDIASGEFVAIMGQSGSGKSTLMNILGCLDRPTSGAYEVLGRNVATLDKDELAALRRDAFGFVFQRYNLLSDASAAENVEIPAAYAGSSKRVRYERALDLLGRLGLRDRAGHRPTQLSGGQQQRVAIARALMNDAPVILADEPTGALDSQSGADVLALLGDLHREGRTVILITHDANVAAHAERLVELRDGRVVRDERKPASGTVAAVPRALGDARRGVWLAEVAEAIKMAGRSMRSNLFRTALTLLGVVIGVAAVVAMLAIGDGSKQDVLDRIAAMGSNQLSIRPGAPGVRGAGDVATLTVADAEAIKAIDNVTIVSPERSMGMILRAGSQDYRTTVSGVWPQYATLREWNTTAGSFLTDADVAGYAPVVVLGATVATNLFGAGSDPVGQFVLVRNVPFEVIGVLEPKGASGWGGDQDDIAFVPLSTGFMRLFGQQFLGSITVKVADGERIGKTESELNALLTERHRTVDFQVRNTASLQEAVSATADTMTALLGSVAAISLIVGGIGVMNIMLVSVTERTREIGIRMATGARMRDILLQFNIEALVVCGIGGLIGVALGLGIGLAARSFGLPVAFSPGPALMAFSCAFLTGVVFGYLPARKAARMDPVAALAYE